MLHPLLKREGGGAEGLSHAGWERTKQGRRSVLSTTFWTNNPAMTGWNARCPRPQNNRQVCVGEWLTRVIQCRNKELL